MTPGHHTRATALLQKIQSMLPAERPSSARWIATPDGELSGDFCPSCAYFRMRHLRKHAEKSLRDDFFIGGAYITEADHIPSCVGCGADLDCSLTNEGVDAEIENFHLHGFFPNPVHTARSLDHCLRSIEYVGRDESDLQVARRSDTIKLSEAFLASLDTPQ